MSSVDEQYTGTLLYWRRKITAWLRAQGWQINRKKVQGSKKADGGAWGDLSQADVEQKAKGSIEVSVFTEEA